MDEIALSLPAGKEWQPLAELVLGGLAARLDFTVDALDDLQLALGQLLSRQPSRPVTVVIRVDPQVIELELGPLGPSVARELEPVEAGVGLHRVLAALTDGVAVEPRDGEAWITLRKVVAPAATA
ncbi:MAG: hypothetical protein ACXVZO_06120 [Gaiellaceae bacterium]